MAYLWHEIDINSCTQVPFGQVILDYTDKIRWTDRQSDFYRLSVHMGRLKQVPYRVYILLFCN